MTLGQHNLLIVIALLLLMVSQAASIILQISRPKKQETPPSQNTDVSFMLSAAAIQKAVVDAQQAAIMAHADAAVAHEDAEKAQNAATTSRPEIVEKQDPTVTAALVAALERNPPQVPSGDTRFLIAPIPIQTMSPSPSQLTPLSGSDHHQILKLATIKITPSLGKGPPHDVKADIPSTKPQPFPGPLNIAATFQATEKEPLTLLNINAFLTTDDSNPGSQGIAGVCPSTEMNKKMPLNNEEQTVPFALELSQGWTPADRRKVKDAWNSAVLYVTFCTTYALDDAIPVLNRQVFKINIDQKTKTRSIEPNQIDDDFLNVSLQ
jgi:hypothetical protein